MKKSNQLKYSLVLFLASLIWGTAFVAQSTGMDHIGGLTFTMIRSFIGTAFLLPIAAIVEHSGRKQEGEVNREKKEKKPLLSRDELIGCLVCGTFLCVATNLQQIGIGLTTVAKAGFLTALYVILVPILGIFLKRRVPGYIWLCAVVSVIGLYFLCLAGKGSFSFTRGDIFEISCALAFALQILSVDHFSPKCRSIVLSAMQFFVCGVETLVILPFLEHPTLTGVIEALPALLYTGIMSSGVAYTLQVVGQKNLPPALASLIMCFESVISAVSGWIILGQKMSGTEIFGATLMFAAIVAAQVLPFLTKEED